MSSWNKTELSCERLDLEGKLKYIDGVEYYLDRHVIGRDRPIDGGVYLGENAREAIVVDSNKYNEINKLYEIAKDKYNKNTDTCSAEALWI